MTHEDKQPESQMTAVAGMWCCVYIYIYIFYTTSVKDRKTDGPPTTQRERKNHQQLQHTLTGNTEKLLQNEPTQTHKNKPKKPKWISRFYKKNWKNRFSEHKKQLLNT